MTTTTTGQIGEQIACSYLMQKGYQILCTNYRTGKLEVDIIAMHRNELVIVEVKTRGTNQFGRPENFVDHKKQQNLIKAANSYVAQHRLNNEVRFDVISLIYNAQQEEVAHFEAAFYPTLNRR